MPTKAELRPQLRLRRAALSSTQRRDGAERAARNALRLPVLREARHVALYLAYGSELSTAPLLRRLLAAGRKIYVPRLQRTGMRFVRITPQTALRRNRHGIREPVGARQRPVRQLDVILLPLLGFDETGNRLGTGGGYYDRALAPRRPFRRPLLVGYAYALQQQPRLPRDPWDVRLDAAITDKGITRWRTG